MSVRTHGRDWEDLATLDPYWAVLTEPGTQHGAWDRDAFFERGRAEVDELVAQMERLGLPAGRDRALDFGCGPGRISRWLAEHFQECVGVDVSPRMVELARELTPAANCRFEVDDGAALPSVAGADFDLVFSRLVLQHIPSRRVILDRVRALVEVLAPGGLLVFQLPSMIPVRHRIQGRPRVYGLLRALGVSTTALYRRGLQPMRMTFVPVPDVTAAINAAGGRLIESDAFVAQTIEYTTYRVTKG